ncbi:MAG: hypothetical protein ACHQQS_07600 [Thermoanaerobaculales bacterium]
MARRDHLAATIVLAGWLVLYLPILLGGRTLPARDVGATQIPWRTVWTEQVRSAGVPLWDPRSSGGRPLLANPNAMAAYPGTLLFLLFPPEAAAAWHLALHHLLLLVGCYRLARRAGSSPVAAAIGAAATGTCGVVWSSLTFLNFQASLTWVIWAVATALPPPRTAVASARRSLTGGALLGLAFLAGEPVTVALGTMAWLAVMVSHWPRRHWPALAAAAVAGGGVAGPVLVPLLATYADTVRARLGMPPGALSADALAPRRYLELLCPNLLGPPFASGSEGFWAASSFPWQRYYPLVFLGGIVLATLPFAARGGRPLRLWWTLAAAGFGGALLLGLAPVASIAERVALFGALRYSVKMLVLPIIALAPLVAGGWESLAQSWHRGGRRWCWTLVVALIAAVPFATATNFFTRPLLAAAYPASSANLRSVPTAQLRRAALRDWFALALTPIGLATVGPVAEVATVATLAGGALGGAQVLLTDSDAVWAQPPAALAVLPARATVAVFAREGTPEQTPDSPGLAVFWRDRAALAPQFGTRWGLSYVLTRGPDGLEPYRQELLAAVVAGLPLDARSAAAQALGAQAVVSTDPIPGWTNVRIDGVWVCLAPHPAPGAYLARREVAAETIVAAAVALASPSFRPGEDVVVDGRIGARTLAGGSMRELPSRPHHRRFEVRLDGPGLLVVQQSYLRCWRATVDGKPVRVEPANGANFGVRLPGGEHAVEVLLDPTPYLIGAAGPLVALLAAVLTWWVGTFRARADATGGSAHTTPANPPAPRR